jgi:sulfide:quinone oxidoreductase
VVPSEASWTIAAYELALLTAAEARGRGLPGVRISVVTHEPRPLEAFGGDVPAAVAGWLDEAGVAVHAGVHAVAHRGGALLTAEGVEVPCDRAVALPGLGVQTIPGLPQREHGFLPTDVQMHVGGLEGVWAAGDATSFPVKQGGLAAQQADVAARTIAARAGARIPIRAFRPVLRAALITGGAVEFLRSHRAGGEAEVAHAPVPLWWPPEKLAGRYLGPLLAAEREGIEFGELIDLDPPDDPIAAEAEGEEAVALLLGAADADARAGRTAKALAQLDLVERLDLVLPAEYVARRDRLRRRLDPRADASPAGRRADPGLVSAAAAISDLEHRVGRLRRLEARGAGAMERDLSRLEEGIHQLRKLSREAGTSRA